MSASVLGRTNAAFPRTWLRLAVPEDPGLIAPLVEAAVASALPLDVSSAPALWGGGMRGTDRVLMCVSSAAYELATEHAHAIDLVQAHLIETLSCIGREYFDFYLLRVRKRVQEFQLAGALEAIELARQEGHIRFTGLFADGAPTAALGVLQLHDAFDVVLVGSAEGVSVLGGLARQRRLGLLSYVPSESADVTLVEVRSAADVGRLA